VTEVSNPARATMELETNCARLSEKRMTGQRVVFRPEEEMPMKKIFNPPSVRRPFGNYNHGLLVPPGASLLVTSGQLGIGLDDEVPETIAEQAELCFEAIQAILADAEMSFADVIRICGFVTKREDFPTYMAVRDRYTLDPKHVSTLIIVGGFTRPEFLVEVEVTAAKIL
jgi:enamine deaminase RidA (YjgF/YER057c/UK114 family)